MRTDLPSLLSLALLSAMAGFMVAVGLTADLAEADLDAAYMQGSINCEAETEGAYYPPAE